MAPAMIWIEYQFLGSTRLWFREWERVHEIQQLHDLAAQMAYRLPQSLEGIQRPANIKIDVKRSVESLGYGLRILSFIPTNYFNSMVCLGTHHHPESCPAACACARICFASAGQALHTPQGLPIHSALITTFFTFQTQFNVFCVLPTYQNGVLQPEHPHIIVVIFEISYIYYVYGLPEAIGHGPHFGDDGKVQGLQYQTNAKPE